MSIPPWVWITPLAFGLLLYLLLLWLKWRQDKKWGKMKEVADWKRDVKIIHRISPASQKFIDGAKAEQDKLRVPDFDPFKKPERRHRRAMWVIAALASTLPSCDSLTATERALLDDAASRAIDRVLPKPVRAQK